MFQLSEKSYFWAAWIILILALLSAGILYRAAAANQNQIESRICSTIIPLKDFPKKLNQWNGRDVVTDNTILDVTGCTDYLMRIYHNAETGQWANIYITFCAHPRNMLGHRPETCFTASGWNIEKEEKIKLTTQSGQSIPCIKYLFEKSVMFGEEIYVLNFYILNGRPTDNHKEFSGIKWRTLTNPDEKVRYVTQIQISSSNEEAAVAAAKEMCDEIIEFFPNKQGFVNSSLAFENN